MFYIFNPKRIPLTAFSFTTKSYNFVIGINSNISKNRFSIYVVMYINLERTCVAEKKQLIYSYHNIVIHFVKHDLNESVEVYRGKNLDPSPTDVTDMVSEDPSQT